MAITNIGNALKYIYQLTQNSGNAASTNHSAQITEKGATVSGLDQAGSSQAVDSVTLRQQQGLNPTHKKVSLLDYKDAVGRDSLFVKETLKSKLKELGLPEHTQINIEKDINGRIVAKGNLLPKALKQLNTDLNNNKPFKAAFLRLSINQPTLNYVDNVVNISKTYGVDNSLFGALISRDKQNNNLTDIATRYEKLRTTYQSDPLAAANSVTADKNYHFVVNT